MQIINDTAVEAYKKVANDKKMDTKDMYWSRWCGPVSTDIYETLARKGWDVKKENGGGWSATFHDFIVMKKDGEDWLIDPTWQQFLPEPQENLPKVLICKMSNLPETLSNVGLPEKQHDIWLTPRRLAQLEAARSSSARELREPNTHTRTSNRGE